MKQFTITESKWARGGKNGNERAPSMLENQFGFRCCLGFLAASCGCDPKEHYMPHEISKMREVAGLAEKVSEYLSRGVRTEDGWSSTALAFDIAEINDNTAMSDQARKEKLLPLFREIGFEPVYVA